MCEKDTAPTMAPSVVVSVQHAVSLAVLWVSGFAESMVCGCKDCGVLRWSHHCLTVSYLECETAVQAVVVATPSNSKLNLSEQIFFLSGTNFWLFGS